MRQASAQGRRSAKCTGAVIPIEPPAGRDVNIGKNQNSPAQIKTRTDFYDGLTQTIAARYQDSAQAMGEEAATTTEMTEAMMAITKSFKELCATTCRS
jgi:hypothetical protein